MILTKNNIKFRSKIKVIESIFDIDRLDWVEGAKYVLKVSNNYFCLVELTSEDIFSYYFLSSNKKNIWS